MRLIERLKRRNRTLLELHLGMVFYGAVCHLAGSFFVEDQLLYGLSLWFGIALAVVSSIHMYRCLDRALDCADTAQKMIFKGYVIRYVSITVILLMIIVTKTLNPLAVFLGYMCLKVAALIQPFTHKLCNKIFHETDPVPQALPEETAEDQEAV